MTSNWTSHSAIARLVDSREGRSLLFLTPTPLYSEKFNSDSNSTPKNFLISYSDSELFKVWETNSDVEITFHASVIFSFDFNNKKRTPTPLRIRQKTPYSDSIPTPGFAHLWLTAFL